MLVFLQRPLRSPTSDCAFTDSLIFTGLLNYATARFDLLQPVRKSDSHQTELYSIALATLHERYPDQEAKCKWYNPNR